MSMLAVFSGKRLCGLGMIGFAALMIHTVPAFAVEPEPEKDLRAEFLMLENELDMITTGAVTNRDESFKYCLNIFDEASEARHVILTKRLKEIEGQVDDRLDKLAVRISELKEWTQKRDDFLALANESVVQIFQSMRPDAAALQLTEVGPAMAASIIAKLEPKFSSAILTEMKPSDAAKIAVVLTNSMETDEKS